MPDNKIRLQKYIAMCGIASRRKAEEMILHGRVRINGRIVKEMGITINPDVETVSVDNSEIRVVKENIYIMLNKPKGIVTTVSDEFNRRNVLDILYEFKEKGVHPVGRLDKDTSGLLILTNDGDFTYKITHPSHEIDKKYIAFIKGIPNKEKINLFQNGLEVDGFITSPAQFNILHIKKHSCEAEIIIHEGKNRQVRKMCSKIGHPVIELRRTEIGNIKLGNLPEGKWRFLKKEEVNNLLYY